MSLFLPFLLPLMIAQAGPVAPKHPAPFRPPAVNPRKAATASVPAPRRPATNAERLAECLDNAESNPQRAISLARTWQLDMTAEPGQAQQCQGIALAKLGRWKEAEGLLLAARDGLLNVDYATKAKLGELAGLAALNAGDPERALKAFDLAVGEADLAGEKLMVGEIEVDRAQALVPLGRLEEAQVALTRAQAALPTDPEVWLLSATLSRRMKQLRTAQAQIEEAARLAPGEPAIGLEAGVIAMLSGRDQAARQSWQSVIAVAPQSAPADTARGYLAQIAPANAGAAGR